MINIPDSFFFSDCVLIELLCIGQNALLGEVFAIFAAATCYELFDNSLKFLFIYLFSIYKEPLTDLMY